MMQPFYDHESDDMKMSFAQLVGYLDFTTSWLLMNALNSNRGATGPKTAIGAAVQQVAFGAMAVGGAGSVVADYQFSLLIVVAT